MKDSELKLIYHQISTIFPTDPLLRKAVIPFGNVVLRQAFEQDKPALAAMLDYAAVSLSPSIIISARSSKRIHSLERPLSPSPTSYCVKDPLLRKAVIPFSNVVLRQAFEQDKPALAAMLNYAAKINVL